jgi:hypothetical protein
VAANRFELLATWYLRFNGYFTTANFSVHPDFKKKSGGTDSDVLAVRFPYSEEFQRRFNFERDPTFIREGQTDFVICEVKTSMCDINPTWRDPERTNVEYALRWMGFESSDDGIKSIAENVYKTGKWESADRRQCLRFVAIGNSLNKTLAQEMPSVQQVEHQQIIEYLTRRFNTGCYQIDRSNWDRDIVEFATTCGERGVKDLLDWAKGVENRHLDLTGSAPSH